MPHKNKYFIYRNARDFSNWFHILHTTYGYFGYPQSAGYVGPFVTGSCRFHGTSSVGTENALGSLAKSASPA